MSSPFAARSIRLGQLFADPIQIEAAPYQRSYAWEAEEAGQLLEDIITALDTDGANGESADYFIGTMLFIDPDRAALLRDNWPMIGPARTFEVVDGLQRLTTLTILFGVLRDLDAEDGAKPHAGLLSAMKTAAGRSRLTLRGRDEEFFKTYVREAGSTGLMPENDPSSPAEERILGVREHFTSALLDMDAAQRRRLADFLLERCSMVMVATVGIDRAYRMFMVLNDTGKPLARNDILKAELLGNVSVAAQASACGVWESMEARLGRDFESLFSHIRTMYGRPGAQVIASIRAIAAENGGAEAFITKVMAPAGAVLDDLRHARHAGSPQSAAITRTLGHLSWLSAGDWMPSALLWALGKGKAPAELAWFLQALERLAYGLRILGFGGSRRAQRFGAVIAAARIGTDLKAANSPLNLTREELRSIDFNLRDLHTRSAPLCKLVLLRLNDEMAGSPQNLVATDLTVEHVLPRKPGPNSPWRKLFSEPQEREYWTEALGNLVLVSKASNDKAGNSDFARKQAICFPAGGQTLAINDFVRRQQQWTAAQVKERNDDLMRRLQTLWGFGGGESGRGTAETGSRRRGRRTKAA